MKTTLDLPDELIHAVKLRAVMQRRTVKDLVAEFLRQGMGMSSATTPAPRPADSMIEIGPDGLPVVRCRADAASTRMDVEALLQLEQAALAEEDAQRAGHPA